MSIYHPNDDECDHHQMDIIDAIVGDDAYIEYFRCLKCGASGKMRYYSLGEIEWEKV